MVPFYPTLSDSLATPLSVVREQASQFADYFGGRCPYSEELKAVLKVVGPAAPGTSSEPLLSEGEDKWEQLQKETMSLYQQLKTFGDTLQVGDTAERMSWFRTSTNLLEKIVSLHERAIGLKELHVFQKTVLELFETILDGDQRTRAITMLRDAIGRAS